MGPPFTRRIGRVSSRPRQDSVGVAGSRASLSPATPFDFHCASRAVLASAPVRRGDPASPSSVGSGRQAQVAQAAEMLAGTRTPVEPARSG